MLSHQSPSRFPSQDTLLQRLTVSEQFLPEETVWSLVGSFPGSLQSSSDFDTRTPGVHPDAMIRLTLMRELLSYINSWFALTRREKTVVVLLTASLLVGESLVLIKRRRNEFADELVIQEGLTTRQLIQMSDSLIATKKEYLRVDINRATADELQLLSGIGEATARKIIAFREKVGPFHEPRDIMRVSGIGENKYAVIEDCIVVEPDNVIPSVGPEGNRPN